MSTSDASDSKTTDSTDASDSSADSSGNSVMCDVSDDSSIVSVCFSFVSAVMSNTNISKSDSTIYDTSESSTANSDASNSDTITDAGTSDGTDSSDEAVVVAEVTVMSSVDGSDSIYGSSGEVVRFC